MKRVFAVLWLDTGLQPPERAYRDLEFAKQYVGTFFDRVIEWTSNGRHHEPVFLDDDAWPRPLIVELDLV